jgi:DNA polymerase/3'-5' exonuclease PolX
VTPARAARLGPDLLNAHVAGVLDETARVLEEQRANPFRVQAYRNAAETVRGLDKGVDDVLDAEGLNGLDRLPGIGSTLARVIDQIVTTGRVPMLERLRGSGSSIAQLASVRGIGTTLAKRLRDDHGIATLEQLEIASHDGTLAEIAGFGPKRIAADARLGSDLLRDRRDRAAANDRHGTGWRTRGASCRPRPRSGMRAPP